MDTAMMIPTMAIMIRRVWPWLAVWAVTALTLVLVWPVRPRLSLTIGDDAWVIGITPDSQSLVLSTWRIDSAQQLIDSGPLQVLSLQTGAVRSIDLPRQSPCMRRVANGSGNLYWEAPDPWQMNRPRAPLRGRWFQCEWTLDGTGDRRGAPNLIVHLGDGTVREAGTNADLELSPTGRFFLENHAPTPKTRRLRISETATGIEQFAFDVEATGNGWAFSPDESHFAYAAITEKKGAPENQLWVWQLAPVKLRHRIDGFFGEPVFSPDGTRLAVVLLKDAKESLVVFDVASGNRVSEHPLGRGFIDNFCYYGPRLEFSRDGEWLIAGDDEYQLSMGDHGDCRRQLSLHTAWRLKTGTSVTFPKDQQDPRETLEWLAPVALPPVLVDGVTPHTIPEGRALAPLRAEESVYDVTADGQTLLVRYYDPNAGQGLQFISQWGLPLPDFLDEWLQPQATWLLKDAATGKVRVVMPESCAEHWLSPDNRTLVVRGEFEPTRLNVYDFPPRPARAAPLM